MAARNMRLWPWVAGVALLVAWLLVPRLLGEQPATVTIREGIVSAVKRQLKLTVLDISVHSDPTRPLVQDSARFTAGPFRLGSYHSEVDWRARARLSYDLTRAMVVRRGLGEVELRVPLPEVEVTFPVQGVHFRKRRVGLFLAESKARKLEQELWRTLQEHVQACLTTSPRLHLLTHRTLDGKLRALLEPITKSTGVRLRIVHMPVVETGDQPRRPVKPVTASCGALGVALEGLI